jgi:hypothetical protein
LRPFANYDNARQGPLVSAREITILASTYK